MADLLKLIAEQGEKLNFINGETATKLQSTLKELGFNLVVDEAKNPEYVPISRLNDEIQKKNLIKTQLDEQGIALDGLKAAAGDKDKIEKLLEAEKLKAADLEKNLQDITVKSAIKLKVAAGDYMAQNGAADDIIRNLDLTKVKINGEAAEGLDEQLKTIKETKPYLFTTQAAQTPPVGSSTNPGGGAGAGSGGQGQGLRGAIANYYATQQ